MRSLKDGFERRKKSSLNPEMLLAKEIDSLKDILVAGRYQTEHKHVGSDQIEIGPYKYSNSSWMAIQDAFRSAVNGTFSCHFVPSEKQKIAVSSLRSQLSNATEAFALGQFLNSLEEQVNEKTPFDDEREKFSTAGIRDLEKKIDELKDLIMNMRKASDSESASMFFELQAGQEIIFNEVDELRSLIPTLTKKNWKQLLKGKLVDLATKQVFSRETMTWIWKKLSSLDLDLNSQNLLNS
jgi:hypothetical protein